MRRLSRKGKRILAAAVPVLVLFFCAWMFGWGRGSIDVIPLEAEEIEHLKLGGISGGKLWSVVVTEEDQIRAAVDAINAFRDTGSSVKDLFRYGIGAGGTSLYEFEVYPREGMRFTVCFGSSHGGQDPADTEVSYWVLGRGGIDWGSRNCRGSMETIYALLEQGTVLT